MLGPEAGRESKLKMLAELIKKMFAMGNKQDEELDLASTPEEKLPPADAQELADEPVSDDVMPQEPEAEEDCEEGDYRKERDEWMRNGHKGKSKGSSKVLFGDNKPSPAPFGKKK